MAPRLERFEPRHPVPLNVHMQKSLSVGPRRLGEVLLIRQIKRVIIASFPVLFLLAWPRVSFTFFVHGLTFSGSSPRHYAIVSLHLRPSELFAFVWSDIQRFDPAALVLWTSRRSKRVPLSVCIGLFRLTFS